MTRESAEPDILVIILVIVGAVAVIALAIRDWLGKRKPPANLVQGANRVANTKPPWARWILENADALFIEPWRVVVSGRPLTLRWWGTVLFLIVLYMFPAYCITWLVFWVVDHL